MEVLNKKEKNKKIIMGVIIGVVFLGIILLILYPTVIKPMKYYKMAEREVANGNYQGAISTLQMINTERGHEMIEQYLSEMVEDEKFTEISLILSNTFYGNYDFDEKDAVVLMNIATKCHIDENHSFALELIKGTEHDLAKSTAFSLAEQCENDDKYTYAAMYYGAAGDYEDSRSRSFKIWDDIIQEKTFNVGDKHTVAIKIDGSVVATGDNTYGQCNVDKWSNIVAITTGGNHTLGLKSDGTVVAVGDNKYGQCDVSDWTDIVAIEAGGDITLGLKSDGTVVSCGSTYSLNGLSNMCCVTGMSVGNYSAVLIKADGSLEGICGNLATGGETIVDDWSNIESFSVGYQHTLGLKSDGSVISTEFTDDEWLRMGYHNQCEIGDIWNAIAISAGRYHTAIVCSDGTAIAIGLNDQGQCSVDGLSDLIDVCAGNKHTVYLTKNGTLVAVGNNEYGQCDVSGWKNIKLPHKEII